MGNSATKGSEKPPPSQKATSTTTPNSKDKKKTQLQKILARFQMCPHKSGKLSNKKSKKDSSSSPPPKPPLRNQLDRTKEQNKLDNSQEWTEVPLSVPESPINNVEHLDAKISPTNYSMAPVPPPRKHKMKLQEMLQSPSQSKNEESSSSDLIEEPWIVPKKVVEHVCDGHHHHVRNVVNGKVVDQIILHEHKGTTTETGKTKAPMNKNQSTLSLPSYDELKKKKEKRKKEPKKSKDSSTSFGSDKKIKPSKTAEKLESYMTRCKSFGSIIPHHGSEKNKQQSHEKESDNESEDSWRGLDDWDLGIIEHDVSKSDSNHMNQGNFKQIENSDKDVPLPLFEKVKVSQQPSVQHNQPSNPRFPSPDKNTKPLAKNTTLEDDLFFTREFLMYEQLSSSAHKIAPPLKEKLAPLARFDEEGGEIHATKKQENDDLLETLQGFCKSSEGRCKQVQLDDKINVASHEVEIIDQSEEDQTPKANPRRKSSKYGHSKLLKFIKDINSSSENVNDATKKEHVIKIHMEDENGHPMKSIHQNKSERSDIEESDIIPEIKDLEASWHRLMKTESSISSLLELESGVSDLLETSSSDSKTTIETLK